MQSFSYKYNVVEESQKTFLGNLYSRWGSLFAFKVNVTKLQFINFEIFWKKKNYVQISYQMSGTSKKLSYHTIVFVKIGQFYFHILKHKYIFKQDHQSLKLSLICIIILKVAHLQTTDHKMILSFKYTFTHPIL